jgi:TusA-related sulfurtransferase
VDAQAHVRGEEVAGRPSGFRYAHDTMVEGEEATGAPAAAASYDAGDLSCGELLIELRRRMLDLGPGDVLSVRATDPAAPLDIPAWCWTTGHRLEREEHPRYWIRRKEG